MKLGHAIRARRVKMHLSLSALAQLAKTSPSYLCRLERGVDRWRTPSVKLIVRLAKACGVPPDEWIGLSGRLPDDVSKWLLTTPGAIASVRRKMGKAA